MTRRLLLHQAYAAGLSRDDPEEEVIKQLFAGITSGVTVSDQEVKDYYKENREVIGGMPFETAKEHLTSFLVQEKRQKAVTDYTKEIEKTLTQMGVGS